MKTQSHMVRDVLAAVSAVVALVVVASLLEGGALATLVAMIALAMTALVLLLVVIHFDEREERLERRARGATGASAGRRAPLAATSLTRGYGHVHRNILVGPEAGEGGRAAVHRPPDPDPEDASRVGRAPSYGAMERIGVPGTPRARVVVVGGGIAAVETAIALARSGEAAAIDITVVSEAPAFVCRPLVVTEPFGGRVPHIPLMPLLGHFVSACRGRGSRRSTATRAGYSSPTGAGGATTHW